MSAWEQTHDAVSKNGYGLSGGYTIALECDQQYA